MAGPDTYGGGGGPGPGPWVSFFVGMRRAAHVVRGPGPLATAALRRAGYTITQTGKAKYYDPSGKRIGRHAARNVGRIYAGKAPVGSGKSWARASVAAWRILNPFPTATAATTRQWPPPYQPQLPRLPPSPLPPPIATVPQPPRPPYTPDYPGAKGPTGLPPDKYPMPPGMPSVYKTIWAYLVASAIMYALPYLAKKAKETWDEYIGRWLDRQANVDTRRKPGGPGSAAPGQRAPRAPRAPTADPGRGDPFPQAGPPAPQIIIIHVPPQVSAPSPATGPAQTPSAPPTPAPAPAPAAKKPLWQQLLEQYGSAPFTQKGKRPIKVVNFMDSLTPSNATGVDSAPMAFGDYAAWSPDSTGTDTCTCPKKKGKKRKKRTVCYRGTYTETASGLTKRKREKVPCK